MPLIESSSTPPRPVVDQAHPHPQTRFFHEGLQTPEAFARSDDYPLARKELFLLFQRLRALLPESGKDRDVAEGLGDQAQIWLGDAHRFDEVRAQMFGVGKHTMISLCDQLALDRSPEAQAVACQHLRRGFCGKTLDVNAVTALAFAHAALLHRRFTIMASPRAADAGAAAAAAGAASPIAALPRAAAATAAVAGPAPQAQALSLPKAADPSLAAILQHIGPDGLRHRCERLADSIDRLIAAVPENHQVLRDRLAAWRDRCATPGPDFNDAHAHMLNGGHRVLTKLHDELNRIDLKQRDAVAQAPIFKRLEAAIPASGWADTLGVHRLARALTKAESVRCGRDNPALDERKQRFLAWAAGLQKDGILTANEVWHGLEGLGLYEPETTGGIGHPMDVCPSNAALRACLGDVPGETGADLLADVRNADLAKTLHRLRERCNDLVVDEADLAALDAFEQAWLCRTPSGGQQDPVGNLHEFGTARLKAILERWDQPGGNRSAMRTTLKRLLTDLATTGDPAALILRNARYDVPFRSLPAAQEALLDDARRAVIDDAIRTSAADLDAGIPEPLIRENCRYVQDRLGIRPAAGDSHAPVDRGLIDTSAAALATLNERTREATNRLLKTLD